MFFIKAGALKLHRHPYLQWIALALLLPLAVVFNDFIYTPALHFLAGSPVADLPPADLDAPLKARGCC